MLPNVCMTKMGKSWLIFNWFTITCFYQHSNALSILVTCEFLNKILHLYQLNSNRDGQKREAALFRSVHDKKLHPLASKTDIVWQVVDDVGIIKQQSEHQQKARYRMADDPERLEAPKEAKNEDWEKSGYIAAWET